MADGRRFLPDQPLDLDQILEEAKHRWLRPSEILEILCNYQRFKLTTEPPVKPSAGSLFLFDRRALRYFRKDGHPWRKKKDGKTVREAHEKLKVGSVDVLHCYYAHGEDNDNFQRRCYWMLDGKLEHIVLVHYREVKEGYKAGMSQLLSDQDTQVEISHSSHVPSLAQTASPGSTAQTPNASSLNRIDWNGQALSTQFEDVDSGNDSGFPVSLRNPPGSLFGSKVDRGSGSSHWHEICDSRKSVSDVHDWKNYAGQGSGADVITHKLTDARLEGETAVLVKMATGYGSISDVDAQAATVASQEVENKSKDGGSTNKDSGELKKLDSFGRWMDKEIGGDCDDSLVASDSGNYWNTLGTGNDDKEVSSLSCHMQLDMDSLGPYLSQEQLFSIRDFSPDSAYSGGETKVLIVGTFLGSKKLGSEVKWGCMFGEIEVSAEVLTDNTIRCHAPFHATGRVPFYITCRNRLACSEVREFEYRENPCRIASLPARSMQEEVHFQMRLSKLLYVGPERKWFFCSLEGCDKCKLKNTLYSMGDYCNKDFQRAWDDMISEGNCVDPKDKLIQTLLKERLCQWLICKVHEEGKGPDVLDDEGQGVIHLAAGLGYEWAMGLIVAASSNPNFRDARGRTALHWASYFGREETVIALVRLGVDPTAVDDPTPASPGGQSAADLASSQGHKGIAGYLAEAFLTRNLTSLNIKKNAMDSAAEAIAAEKTTEIAAQVAVPSQGGVDEQISLKGSLAAVRKSAHAAALIQAAYRADSFRHRQLSKNSDDISEVSLDLAALGPFNNIQRRSHFEDYLHSAATKIQQKYRGWKGRKEFLKIRNRIVKIQAHVRGHQARKQYKRFVWSVGIVEKAILRWRRKGAGLRGFRVKMATGDVVPETENPDEYEFLRISRRQKYAGVDNALKRVTSMVRNPEARDQYMRLVARFENLKMADDGNNVSLQGKGSQ